MHNTMLRALALAGICATAFACSSGDNAYGDSTGAMASDTSMRMDSAGGSTAAPLTDANIAAIMDQANRADSAAGSIAAEKATSSDVREFGRMMMRDHHQLREQGEQLVQKLSINPQLPEGSNAVDQAQAWRDGLESMPKGVAWDRAYMDHAVAYHAAVIAITKQAINDANNPDLKDLLQTAEPKLQEHLDRAKQIRDGLTTDTNA